VVVCTPQTLNNYLVLHRDMSDGEVKAEVRCARRFIDLALHKFGRVCIDEADNKMDLSGHTDLDSVAKGSFNSLLYTCVRDVPTIAFSATGHFPNLLYECSHVDMLLDKIGKQPIFVRLRTKYICEAQESEPTLGEKRKNWAQPASIATVIHQYMAHYAIRVQAGSMPGSIIFYVGSSQNLLDGVSSANTKIKQYGIKCPFTGKLLRGGAVCSEDKASQKNLDSFRSGLTRLLLRNCSVPVLV
jgi:hypothetical protein